MINLLPKYIDTGVLRAGCYPLSLNEPEKENMIFATGSLASFNFFQNFLNWSASYLADLYHIFYTDWYPCSFMGNFK